MPLEEFRGDLDGVKSFEGETDEEKKAREKRPGLLRETGGQILDAVTHHIPGAVAAAIEGDQPFKERDWKDALIERSRKRSEEVAAQPGGKDPLGPFGAFSREDVRNLGPSLGFSAVGAGAGIGVGAPVSALTGPVSGFAAGGTASGKVAYDMSANQFLRDARRKLDDDSMKERGVTVSDDEWKAVEPKYMEAAHEYGLWEAVPEAVGNMLGAGILMSPARKLVPKALSGLADKNILTRGATKAAALQLEELPTETVTQMGQHNVEVGAGLGEPGAKPRSWTSVGDWWDSFKEIVGPTVLQTGVMGVGGAAVHKAYKTLAPSEPPVTTEHDALLREVARTAGRQASEPNAAEQVAPAATRAPTPVASTDGAKGTEPDPAAPSQAYPRELDALRALKAGGELALEDSGYLTQAKLARANQDGSLKILPAGRRRLKELELAQPIDEAAHAAATSAENDRPEPTGDQKTAGNYAKGHVDVGGLDISIENPEGTKRRPEWPTLKDHYGYIKGVPARAPDKDHVDVFVKPGTAAGFAGDVFVVDQFRKGGAEFDEPKVMIGYADEKEAGESYQRNYTKGWTGGKAITPMPMEAFKAALQDPQAFMRPQSYNKREAAAVATLPAVKAATGLRSDQRRPNTLYILGADWSTSSRKESREAVEHGGDPLAAFNAFKASNPDIHPQLSVATDAQGKPWKVVSPNGKVHDYDSAQGRYALGDVDAFRKAADAGIEQGRDEGDPDKVNAAADEIIARLKQQITRAAAALERDGKEIAEAKKKQKAGVPVKDVDGRFDTWKEYLANRRRIVEAITDGQEKDQAELATWEARKVKDVSRPAILDAEVPALGGGPKPFVFQMQTGSSAPVESVEDAAQKWEALRDAHIREGGGGVSMIGNGGSIIDAKSGKVVATITYNGRVLKPEGTEMGATIDVTPEKELPAQKRTQKPALAAPSIATAKTGQPFEAKLMRGQGREGSPYNPLVPQEGILGPGRYTTNDREFAQHFGATITEHQVRLENPLVIENDAQWRALTKRAGWEFPNPISMTGDTTKASANIKRLRDIVNADGHDGIVVRVPEHEVDGKTMQNVFGADQVIEFTKGARDDKPQQHPKADAARTEPPAAAAEEKPAVTWKKAAIVPTREGVKAVEIPAELTEEERAKADLQAALADLGDLIGKNGRLNITPEQEQKLLPVMTRLFDAAFRLGYVKFKQAARFVRGKIQDALGKEVADELSLEHYQGGYIAMSGRYKEKGAESAKEVAAVDSLDEEQVEFTVQPLRKGAPAETLKVSALPAMAAAPAKRPVTPQVEALPSTAPLGAKPAEPATPMAQAAQALRTAADAIDKAVAPPVETPAQQEDNGGQDVRDLPASGEGSAEVESAGPARPAPEKRGAGRVRAGEGDGGQRVSGARAVEVNRPEEGVVQNGPHDEGAGHDGNRPDGEGDRAGRARVPAGSNYRIQPGDLTYEGSWRQKAAANVEAIRIAKALEQEGRKATPEEQAKLVRFIGWGASEIANGVFPDKYGDYKDEAWRKLGEQLSALLTEDEYKAAQRTTQYAHYTSRAVIQSVFGAIERMGFTGGRAIEPGMGIGHFAGLMPEAMARATVYTGIEYDPVPAAIAKALYPRHNIINGDYTKTDLPDDFFDIAIGNPPFSGQVRVANDPRYRKYNFALHDYFFAKTLDKVRPGGLVVFVTSAGTMNKASDRARVFMAERANLLGAIRLPQTAFIKNAGTEVVTDVLFLQKKGEGVQDYGQKWMDLKDVPAKDGEVAQVNEYFADHPDMVLGEHAMTGKMYGSNKNYNVEARAGENIEEAFGRAAALLPAGVYQPIKGSKEERAKVDLVDYNPAAQKEGNFYVKDGKLFQRSMGMGKPAEISKASEKVLRDFIGLRDSLKQAHFDQLTDGPWQGSLKALQKAYRTFKDKHGRVNQFKGYERIDKEGKRHEWRRYPLHNIIDDDPDWTLVAALETENEETGVISEGQFLSERVLNRPTLPKIETVQDAMYVQLDQDGELDLDRIAELSKTTKPQAIEVLGDAIFETPAGKWQTADEYLSGNVGQKAKEARAAAEVDKRFARNLPALEAAVPKPIPPSEITARLGAPFIDPEYVEAFFKEKVGLGVKVEYNPVGNIWSVMALGGQKSVEAISEWGTARRNAFDLLEHALTKTQLRVMSPVPDSEKKAFDPVATAAAADKLKKMHEAFSGWIWTDGDRASKVADIYNDRFNNIAPRAFDGTHLTLPGLSSKIRLRPHQKRVVWRIIQRGNTYIAHAVGAGKTLEMVVAGMEMRRLGLVKKPQYVVPNHMLQQFAREFMQAYPTAKVLVADEKEFHSDNRRKFVAKASLSDLDAIIITQSAFKLVDTKPEFKHALIQGMIDEMKAAMEGLEGRDPSKKQLERNIETMEKRLEGDLSAANRDKNVFFEDMGVDFLFVDEAHLYRKLAFVTNQGNIKGIDPNGSMYALDLYTKTRWLEEQHPGRNLVMASGTPVTNTVGELYTVQRYMAEKVLEERGLRQFDAWAAMFGMERTGLEQNAAGHYAPVTRFAAFVNVPELSQMFRDFADVIVNRDLGDLVPRPKVINGGRQMRIAPATDTVKDFQKTLAARMVKIEMRKGPPKKGDDILLSVINDGRLLAIDPRFVIPGGVNQPESKLNQMLDEVIETYRTTKDWKYQDENGKPHPTAGAAQVVFSDLGFGDQVAASRGFDARAWVMKRYAAAGILPQQVAFMSDFHKSTDKLKLFKDVNSGKVRIVHGSSKNMGVGTNIQRRLYWEHHLDAPWYPADMEQREGRILRQGNQNPEIGISAWATKGTYDSTMFQMNATKSRFIEQLMTGDATLRTMQDVSEASQYEMAQAISSGDERVIKLAGLKSELEGLNRLFAGFIDDQQTLKRKIGDADYYIRARGTQIEALAKDLDKAAPALENPHHLTATISGKTFDKPKEAGETMLALLKAHAEKMYEGKETIGQINGFDVELEGVLERDSKGKPKAYGAYLGLKLASGDHTLASFGSAQEASPVGAVMRATNHISALPGKVAGFEEEIENYKKTKKAAQARVGGQFEYQQKMEDVRRDIEGIEGALKEEAAAAKAAAQTVEPPAATEAPTIADDKPVFDDDVEDEEGGPAGAFSRQADNIDAYKLTAGKDRNGMPAFANTSIVLMRANKDKIISRGEGVNTYQWKIFDRRQPGEHGDRFLKVGELHADLTPDGTFEALRNIVIYPRFRQKGNGYGEDVVASLLATNTGNAIPMTVYNILHDTGTPEFDAIHFWRKMGVRFHNLSNDPGVEIDGDVSLNAYLRAREERGSFRRDEGSNLQFNPQGQEAADAAGGPSGTRRNDGATQERERAASGAGREGIPGRSGQQDEPRVGLTPTAVRQAVEELFQSWPNGPHLRVVASMDDPAVPAIVREQDAAQRASGATGAPSAFIHGNTAYLVADGIDSEWKAQQALLHEALGHYGLRKVFGEGLRPILRDVAAAMPDKVRAKAKEYGLDMAKEKDRLVAAEEILAELAQTRPQAGMVRRAIAYIRQWLRDHGIHIELSNNDIIVNFILPAREFVTTAPLPRGGTSTTAPAFGRKQLSRDQTTTEVFKKWFGKSKVVDDNGKPLVVYHGTNADFDSFSEDYFGENTGTGDWGDGFYFTNDPAIASSYAKGDGANVKPIYLSMKNPARKRTMLSRWMQDVLDDGMGFESAQEALEGKGYDGIIFDHPNGRGREYVVFRPEQIKSAIGNRGTFDPENPDIRFSRTQTLTEARIREEVGNLFQSQRTFNRWWHRTIGTQFHKAQQDDGFRRVFDLGQDYLTDTSRYAMQAEAEAPNLLLRMEGAKDILKRGISAGDKTKIMAPLFEGTLEDKSFTDDELREQWGLNAKQVGLYREFRAATNKSLDELAKSTLAKMANAIGVKIPGSLALRDLDLNQFHSEILNRVKFRVRTLKEQAEAMADGDQGRHLALARAREAQAQATQMNALFNKVEDLKRKGYAPLQRFGEYTVYVTQDAPNPLEEPEQVFFGMYESQREANAAAKALAEEYPEAQVQQGILSKEAWRLYQGMSPDTLEVFAKAAGLDAEPIFQQYLRLAVNNRSAMKRLMKRKGTPGFSQDVTRVLATFVTSNARLTSSNWHLGEMQAAVDAIPRSQGDVKDEAIRLWKYLTDPQEEAGGLRGFLFFQYLGGSIASAMVNVTQPLTMTFPELTKYASPPAVAKELARATMEAAANKPGADMIQAYRRAADEGITAPHEIYQLMAQARGNALGATGIGKAMKVWGSFFSLAESFNRRTTFIAAYRLGVKNNVANPYEFAREAVYSTQGIYNKGNRPNWARGSVGATLFTFKQFSIAYIEFLKRLHATDQRAFWIAIAVLTLAAGAEGLPFAEDIEDMLDTIGQWLGYTTNSKKFLRERAAEYLGEGAGQFVLHGVSALPGVPLDVAGRMGMHNLIPGTAILKESEEDKTRDVAEFAGPLGGLAQSAGRSVAAAAKGDFGKAVEGMMPQAVQNMLKGAEMWEKGYYTDTKGRRVIDTTAGEAILKAAGFQPSVVAKESRAVSAAMQDINLHKVTEAGIADKWARGVADDRPELVDQARAELESWNEKNRDSPIRLLPAQIRSRVKAIKETRAERFVKTAPKEIRGQVASDISR